jgi:aminopeptidase N
MLLAGLHQASNAELQTLMVHPVTHTALLSNRLWIYEGAAHFAQALEREQQAGRQSALDFLQQQLPALTQVDKDPDPNRSLVTSYDELLFRAKALAVFWMLRDLIGDAPLETALKKYDAAQDKEPSYFQKLLEAESKKDLEWFFDDWVYRDRGLPDFKVDSVYTRQILHGGFLATVTVENLGGAAAEVPVMVHFEHGDIRQRVTVKAHEKASARVEVATPPLEVTVNDGSVPESDNTNNSYTVPPPPQ